MQTSSNTIQKIGTAVLTMPAELRAFTILNAPHKSPYNGAQSGSFYDCSDKTWSYTPDGSIRVSDHWNFRTRSYYGESKIHCQTDICNSRLIGKWAVGKYNAANGLYHIISIDEKDVTAYEKHVTRINTKQYSVTENEIRNKRLLKVAQIKAKKAAAERARKIRNANLGLKGTKIWVEVEVNLWSRKRGRNYHEGTETIFGCIIWESQNGNWLRVKNAFGHVREIRSCVSYKEFSRKPKM